jgi:hypothetical protein
VNSDFSDLFAAFNGAGARYLVVGGYALAFHAEPRYTKDLDVWVEATPENADRVYAALGVFGAPLEQVTAHDLSRNDVVFQIGVPPNRIDIVTSIDGVTFAEAWPNRVESTYGEQRMALIGRGDLVRNKQAAARPQDLLDLSVLARHE